MDMIEQSESDVQTKEKDEFMDSDRKYSQERIRPTTLQQFKY